MTNVDVVAVADRIIHLLDEETGHNIKLVSGAEDEVRNLAHALKEIKIVLDEAETRRYADRRIKLWLSRLEQTIQEIEGVLDEWNNAIHKLQISVSSPPPEQKVHSSVPSSSSLWFDVVDHDIVNKLLEKKAKLDEVSELKSAFGSVISPAPVPKFPSTSYVDSGKVFGRDSDTDILVSKILDSSVSQEELGIPVLSIVGPVGVGKTTLAQLVYNHSRVRESFEVRIWICVSDTFDLTVIARGILESIEGSSPNTNKLDVLFERVSGTLSGNKFFLVLDDVWTENFSEWDSLKYFLKYGGAGSKILVTTRKENVAKMMRSRGGEIYHPGLLSDKDCWLILRHMLSLGRNEAELEEIGMKIAEKCHGLPLTVKTWGGHLHHKRSLKEWEKILNNETWEMEEAEDYTFPDLLLTYNKLPQTLKQCFSYCAVFPKDSKIVVENLIDSWIAMGYLGSDDYDLELKGRRCYDDLVNNSLLQDLSKDDHCDETHSCKMHGIVYDFAQFLRDKRTTEEARMSKSTTCRVCNRSQVSTEIEFCTLYCDEETPPNLCAACLTRLRVLSLANCGLQSIPRGMEHLNHLRYLNLIGIAETYLEDLKIIFQLRELRTLGLRKCGLKEVPREIGNLIRLRRLDLSWNESLKELPREIWKLIQLRHLNLSRNKCLKKLPRDIGNLINLTHLDLSWNESLKRLPREIGKLISLENLYLERNVSMKMLPREIGKLIKLRRLDLSWNESLEELPYEIQKLTDLRHLKLNGNKSLKELPESICDLRRLRTLNILGCKRICRLPNGVSKLTSLRTLDEFRGGSGCNKFGLLENLNDLGGVLWLRIRLDGYFKRKVVDDARAAKLSDKTRIDELRIYFEEEQQEEEESISLNVIDVLQPHSMLRELSIWNYGCSKFPSWMLSSQVRKLNLHFCKHLISMPPLGKLPCLEELCIDLMEALETVGREFLGIATGGGRDVIAFPKLKTLEFRDCGEWKEWEDVTEEEESAATSVMPCLTKLTITGCNGLTLLPHRILHKALSLEKLRISGSTELVRRYGKMDGSDWESISLNNPRLHLTSYS